MDIREASKIHKIVFVFAATLFASHLFFFMEAVGVPPWKDNDFAHFFLTARLTMDGVNPYRAALEPIYSEYGFTPKRVVIASATNPPGLVSLTLFLPWMNPKTGYLIWSTLQFLSVMVALKLILRLYPVVSRPAEVAILIAVTTISHPMFQLIRFGQAQGILLLLLVAGLALIKKAERRPAQLAGAFLWGLAAGIKIFPLPLLYVAARYGGRRAAAGFALGVLVPQIPFVWLAGPQAFFDFFSHALPYIQRSAILYLGNVSIPPSVVFSCVVLSVNPYLLMDIFRIASGAAALAFAGVILHDAGRPRGIDRSFAVVLLGILLFSPTAWTNYLILAFPPIAYLACLSRANLPWRPGLTAALMSYLLVGSSPGWLTVGPAWVQLASIWTAAAGVLIAFVAISRFSRAGA